MKILQKVLGGGGTFLTHTVDIYNVQYRSVMYSYIGWTLSRHCEITNISPTLRGTQGRNHGWKVDGDQGLGPNTGAFAPRARPKAALGVGCGGVAPSRCVGPGVSHRKIFRKLRCWILHSGDYLLWNSCFLKTTAKKLGETNTLLVPT